MTSITTLQKYAGRTVDLLAYHRPKQPQQPVVPQLATAAGSQVVTGIQKLAQAFLLELLTERGSMPYRPQAGTHFIGRLARGHFRNEYDLSAAFAAAVTDIQINLALTEDETTPEDERLASAELQSAVITQGKVQLVVRIHSLAGDSRELILPLPITV